MMSKFFTNGSAPVKLKHFFLLMLGSLLGFCLAAFIQSLPMVYGWDLEKARSLGIVSQTILDGYPKEQDVIGYAVLLISTVGGGVALWWGWACRKHDSLLCLKEAETEVIPAYQRLVWLAAVAVFVPFLVWYAPALFSGPVDSWFFWGEEGVMLAAVNDILAGKIQGRDFLGPHGPTMTLLLAWFMTLFGRSVLAARYFSFGLHIASYLVVAFILQHTIRKTTLTLFFLFLFIVIFPVNIIPHSSYLRFTMAIIPILLYAAGRSVSSLAFAGLILGQSLLFSQEAGICSVAALLLVWSLKREETLSSRIKNGLILATSCLASLLPFLLYVTAKGGFDAFIVNMISYPKLIALGYCALPFPSLGALLASPTESTLIYYWPLCIYVIALLYVIPPLMLGNRSIHLMQIAAIALYGVLLFRIALGRSDLAHLMNATPPAFLLFAVITDRCWKWASSVFDFHGKRVNRFIGIGVVSIVVSAILFPLVHNNAQAIARRWFGNKPTTGQATQGFSYSGLAALDGILLADADYRQVAVIDIFLKNNRKNNEMVYFFPNEPMSYFIFNLPSPTRFHQAYQAITIDQRLEAVRDLGRNKPKYLVYNYSYLHRIDGIPEQIQVPEILKYLQSSYSICQQSDMVAIFARNGEGCSGN